jgi:hypothetical protein
MAQTSPIRLQLNGIQEVVGSIPIGSTSPRFARPDGAEVSTGSSRFASTQIR